MTYLKTMLHAELVGALGAWEERKIGDEIRARCAISMASIDLRWTQRLRREG
jgi:hypothetical protein